MSAITDWINAILAWFGLAPEEELSEDEKWRLACQDLAEESASSAAEEVQQ